MKQILVPTDFSQTSENAVEYAVQLAKAMDTPILLFHSYEIPTLVTEGAVVVVPSDEIQKINEETLKKYAEKLTAKWGIEINYSTRAGIAPDEILKEARNGSLIVMGMHGAGRLARAIMGSTALDVMKHSQIPVLLIPENVTYKRPEKIAFACDYNSKTDFYALSPLKRLIENFNSNLLVMNIKDDHKEVSMEEKATAVTIDRKLTDIDHSYHFMQSEDLVDGIKEFIDDKKPDIIAVIPHKYNLLERLSHRSTTKKLVLQTTIPFLALPDVNK